MILIVGLGNPGEQFENTRHNIGREIIELFGKKNAFPDFRFEKKWNSRVAEGALHKEKVLLLFPDTMMNDSGKAVGPAARFYKVKPKNIFLVHDDADIALGKGKLAFAKNSAGHKGVESVIRMLKTNEFWRFRIGIAGKRRIRAEKLVLKKWTPEETRAIKKIIARTLQALETTIDEGPEKAMNEYNK